MTRPDPSNRHGAAATATPPVVVAIIGPSAVGKTTLATRLACTLAARVIRLRALARA